MRNFVVIFAVGAVVTQAQATLPILLTIDSTLSSADFQVCIGETCDSAVSAISGGILMDLDAAVAPTQTNLFDFAFELVDDLEVFLDLGVGGVAVSATDVLLMYPTPGVPVGPIPIDVDVFEFMDVPALASGVASYNADPIPCLILAPLGLPCEWVFDLDALGVQSLDAMGGTLSIAGDEVTVTADVALSLPIIPDAPDLATISFVGTIVATGLLPECASGDFDCDGAVDVFDFAAFVACASGPGGGILLDGCETFDFDADVDVDLNDFGGFQGIFGGS